MKKTPEKNPSVSFLKALAFGGAFLCLMGFSAFFRYFYTSFASAPVLLVEENSESPYVISKNGSFVLEFDQRMRKESVESSIRFQPEIPYSSLWEGRKLFLKPEQALRENTTYYLSLAKGPLSLLGKPLSKSYLLKYELGGDPELQKIFPETEALLPDEKIIIMFSDPMVGEGEIGKNIEPAFLRLTPTTEGSWTWKNSRVLTWSPKTSTPLSTRFHLESIGEMETYGKAQIKEKIDRTFQTARLNAVERTQDLPLKVSDPMVLEFNQQVGPRNLERHLSVLDASGKKEEKIFVTERRDGERYMYEIRTAGNWSYNEQYRLQVSSELMPEVGNIGLEESLEVKISTEEILTDATFRYSEAREVLHANGVIRFWLRENMPIETLNDSIQFLPKIPFEISKGDDGAYEVRINDVSQIRENSKFIITSKLNTELQTFLKSPVEYSVKQVKNLLVEVTENESLVCIFSNYPLTAKSVVVLGNKTWRLEKGDEETCGKGHENIYTFRKQLLEPGQVITFRISSEDVFNQKDEKVFTTTTSNLKAQDIIMNSGLKNFYTSAKTKDKMKFPYTTTNVTRVNVQVCKISSELAVSIEGGYEEKWNSFFPSAEKCLKYKSYFDDFDPEWGMEKNHELDIEQVFGEVTSGLYYVHVSTPSFFDGDGRALQASGVLNFNSWNILSKRGDSSLVWITENEKPVSNVIVNFYSSDGSLLTSGRTDPQGLYYVERNKIKYEFITAKKGDDEALLNVFYQDGLEPNRFSILSNKEENPYLYQFYLEEGTINQRSINGVFILKEKDGSIPKSPQVSGATVTLYDSEEQLLWRQHEPMDDFGNLYFEISPPHPLLDGKYFLGVCLGLHEGVCHGTFLWTTYYKGYQQENNWSRVGTHEEKDSGLLEIDTKKEYKPGDEISIRIKNLTPKVPALISLERDLIYWKKIVIPQTTEDEVKVIVTEDMIPEMMVTVYQPNAEESLYDMKRVDIKRDFKKLTYQRSNSEADYWRLPDGKKAEEISQITFELETNKPYEEGLVFRSFYPKQGTSIITSSIGTEWKNQMSGDQSNYLSIETIPDLIVIDGVLRREPVQQSSDQSFYFLAHDKNGRFGNTVISGVHHEEKKITIDMKVPQFMRAGDQVIFSVDLENNFDENKNLQLVSRSNALTILNGESVFLGLAGHQKKTLHIATSMSAVPEVIPLFFDLYEKDVLEAEYSTEIPVIASRLQEAPDDLLVYETPQGRGTIKIPFPEAGQWETHLMISTSPLSYVLENIQYVLKKEALSFDETVFKRTIEANYSSLMKDSFEDHESLRGIIEKKSTVENFLYYLGERQKNDGGWSYFPEETVSDPTLSSWIAKSVATLEQVGFDIPEGLRKNITTYLKEQLDDRVNVRIREGIANIDISEENMFQELLILNALSSFTPSGVSYANSWYNTAEKMPSHSLVLLLLTLEDYRDAQISGMNYKIEEVTQILNSRQENIQNQVWLRGDGEKKFATDFLVTSWYLEALIRQSSARSDVPSVITWLVKNKYLQSHQSQKDQFSFIQAMASYLRIYQEEILSEEITLVVGKQLNKKIPLIPEKRFQSFFLKEEVTTSEDSEDFYIDFSSNKDQPLFIEVNWKKKETNDKALFNGITLSQSFNTDAKWAKGEKVTGKISVIVPEPLQNVLITHPIISAARDLGQKDLPNIKVKTLGKDEKWYFIPVLPAGETIIPFEWQLTQAGIYVTPRIQAYAMDKPKTLSTSNTLKLEIRNGE